MSDTRSGLSRRTLAKGAAWAVPAVAVAAAAPAYAASEGPIRLTGKACKLPGNSSPPYKQGYLYEATIRNILGPNPDDAVFEITGLSVNGVPQDWIGYKFVEDLANPGQAVPPNGPTTCSCSGCGTKPLRFCVPDGGHYRILIYSDERGSSGNDVLRIDYNVYDCKNTAICGTGTAEFSTTPVADAPPTQDGGGGSCKIPWTDVFPLPTAYWYGEGPAPELRMMETQAAPEEQPAPQEAPTPTTSPRSTTKPAPKQTTKASPEPSATAKAPAPEAPKAPVSEAPKAPAPESPQAKPITSKAPKPVAPETPKPSAPATPAG